MHTARLAAAALVCAAAVPVSVSAATVSASQAITTTGQTLNLSAATAADNLGGGILNITLKGDFSSNYASHEYADLSLDVLGGTMRLAYAGPTYVVSNTIAGVTLLSSTAVENIPYYDSQLTYSFSVSASALSAILADNQFNATFALGLYVNPYDEWETDYVSASLTYTAAPVDGPAPVPLPAALPLLGAGLAGLGRG